MDRLQQRANQADGDGRRTVVTVVNSLSPTSMPLNEFVSWRARRFPAEWHVVLSLASAPAGREPMQFPAGVKVLAGAGSSREFRTLVRSTVADVATGPGRALVHLHHPRSGALFHAVRPASIADLPVLFTVHNMFERYHPATKLLSAFNCTRSDRITFVSHAAAGSFPDLLRGRRPEAYRVIPNGVDLERVDATLASVRGVDAGRSVPQRTFELVNVGKFTRQKGHEFLLEVVRRLPDVGLTLVGDGPLRPSIESRARDEGLTDRVRFTGLVPRETVYAELLAADLFVSPALWEGLPIAVLEAMALGRPMLLSDIEPHREIRRERSELKLLPFEIEAWTESIRGLAELPADAVVEDGRANRRTVERAFTLARMHEEYSRLYDELLGPEGDPA